MKIRNWTLLIALSALACAFYFYITPVYLHPAEDAAILFNYAQNLHETGVISYYPGGPRADGTTDFLFMGLVSFLLNFTDDAYKAAMMVSALSVMVMMFFIFRLLDTRSLTLQYLTLFLVFFSQQIWASVLGYGTMFFAMAICWAIVAYWRGKLQVLAIAASVAVMARPDGLITVLPLLAHKLYAEKGSHWSKSLKVLLLFVLPLGLYGLFRWMYFGHILPLSFDINTAGYDKVWGIFPINSIHHVKGYAIHYVWPGLLGLALFTLKQKFRLEPGYYVLMAATIVLPMLAYLTIRENLDFSRRYFIVPYIGIVLTMMLLIRNHKSIILSIFGVILLGKTFLTSFEQGVNSFSHYYNNMYLVGSELSELPSLKLATSEAGIIPWKSRYKTMDVWGLNTSDLTKRLVQTEDLQQWKADLVVFHAAEVDYVLLDKNNIGNEKNWLNLSHTIIRSLYDMQYTVYLLPYDWRNYKDGTIESHGLLKTFFKWVSEQQKKAPTKRRDLFAIHPNSPYKKELTDILQQHGGEPFIIKAPSFVIHQ